MGLSASILPTTAFFSQYFDYFPLFLSWRPLVFPNHPLLSWHTYIPSIPKRAFPNFSSYATIFPFPRKGSWPPPRRRPCPSVFSVRVVSSYQLVGSPSSLLLFPLSLFSPPRPQRPPNEVKFGGLLLPFPSEGHTKGSQRGRRGKDPKKLSPAESSPAFRPQRRKSRVRTSGAGTRSGGGKTKGDGWSHCRNFRKHVSTFSALCHPAPTA